MSEVKSTLLAEKLDDWNCHDKNNYVADHEITVEIALNEYRLLVIDKSVSDYKFDKIQDENRDLRNKLSESQEKIKELTDRYNKLYMDFTDYKKENNDV